MSEVDSAVILFMVINQCREVGSLSQLLDGRSFIGFWVVPKYSKIFYQWYF